MISSRCAVPLVDGALWMKLLPVSGINADDRAVGILLKNLAANDVHHHKTPVRVVAVDAADDRLSYGMLFHIHFDVHLHLRGDREYRTLVTAIFRHTGTTSSGRH